MKKTIAILLVAVLAVSSVFAGFEGKATVGLGYNWETKEYGFSNGTGFDVNVDLATEEADKVAEGDIYAGIKATMGVKVANRAEAAKKGADIYDSKSEGNANYGLGLMLKVAEAYVAGENWKVAITGTKGATSYAKSFETVKGDVKDVFGNVIDEEDVAYDLTGDLFAFNKAPGVTVEVAGFKGSVGFNGSEKETNKVKFSVPATDENGFTGEFNEVELPVGKYFNYNALVETPSYDVNGLTLQAAVGASRKVDNYGAFSVELKKIKFEVREVYIPVSITPKYYDLAINTSAKVGYATDTLSVAVAADYDAVKYLKDDNTIISYFDASANVKFAPVTVDAYYGLNGMAIKLLNANNAPSKVKTLAHKLSAQVTTDLAAFDLPVKVTVWGKDILNTMDYGAKAEVTIDAIKLGVNGGYVIDPLYLKKIADVNVGKYYLGADVEYTNDLFTAKAGVGFNSYVGKDVKDAAQLTLSASVESSAIIPGATLKLAYGAAKDSQNLLKDQITLLQPAQNLGKVEATCTIKF